LTSATPGLPAPLKSAATISPAVVDVTDDDEAGPSYAPTGWITPLPQVPDVESTCQERARTTCQDSQCNGG
jgi:hypothetical protein